MPKKLSAGISWLLILVMLFVTSPVSALQLSHASSTTLEDKVSWEKQKLVEKEISIDDIDRNHMNESYSAADIPEQTLKNSERSSSQPAKDPMRVYTSLTKSNSNNSGDGSKQNPYNRFEDAVANVQDGGTIYILSSNYAFLNTQDEYGVVPFIIDKNITIKPEEGADHAELHVRAGGILLDADVTFENISLSFANPYHDSIFANGHTLTLINVTRPNGARYIDLFAGGLYKKGETSPLLPSGSKGVINIETNNDFGDSSYKSTFGNIYGGSMNGKFDGSVEINITENNDFRRLDLGEIYASGALEAQVGNMFEMKEPDPPEPKPNEYTTKGHVSIALTDYTLPIDGSGALGGTSLTTSVYYPREAELYNVESIVVEHGRFTPIIQDNPVSLSSISIKDGGELDLSKVGNRISVTNYYGGGIVTLARNATLNITDTLNGRLQFQTEGAFDGKSGIVVHNHTYITASKIVNEDVSFEPHNGQTDWSLVQKTTSNSGFEWVAEMPYLGDLPSITDISIKPENAKQIKTFSEINGENATDIAFNFTPPSFLIQVETDQDTSPDSIYLDDYYFDLSINGKQAERRMDDDGYPAYFVDDLNLYVSLYYADSVDSNILVLNGIRQANYSIPALKKGNYEIVLSYTKSDGSVVSLTAYLTVIDDLPESSTPNAGTSTISFGKINSTINYGSKLNIPVTVTQSTTKKSNRTTLEKDKIYLYVNGKQVADQSAASMTSFNIAVSKENNFKVGDNEISAVYSGTDHYGASVVNYDSPIVVNKTTPTITLHNNNHKTYAYDGEMKYFNPDVTVTVGEEAIVNPDVTIAYKNIAASNGSISEEAPIFPGIYQTVITVPESDICSEKSIDGPTITITKATPQIHVTGKVDHNGDLVITAQVNGVSSVAIPGGEVAFYVDGKLVGKSTLSYGEINYPIIGLSEGNYEVTVSYIDYTGIYTDVQSDPIILSNLLENPVENPNKLEGKLNFKDVTSAYRAYEEISYLSVGKIILGDQSNRFIPNRQVTRAQAAAMIGRALQLDGERKNTIFKDVGVNNFASGFIQSAVESGIIAGYGDGTFRPDGIVTRGEMAIMISRAFGYDFGGTTAGAGEALMKRGISQGISDGTFGANLKLIRADFAVFLARAIDSELRIGKPTITFESEKTVTVDELIVRTGPSNDYSMASELRKNAKVSIGYKVGKWTVVKTGRGVIGFVPNEALK